jgi:hypothetical protein
VARTRITALVAAGAAAIALVLALISSSGAAASICGAGSGGGIAAPQLSGGTGITSGGTGTGTGTGTTTDQTSCAGKYVRPTRGIAWMPGRTDMGVDFDVTRHKPIVAIGDAVILGSDNRSGWPGGHFLWYRLLDGDHAGDVIYVAETMGRMLPTGTTVTAGERIATAMPGGTGTEWGWANKAGSPRAAPCYSEGMKTNSGREFARFLRHLGAKTADPPGPGPDYPSGKRC